MRTLAATLAVTSLALAMLLVPSATATHDTCDGENEVVVDDLRDSDPYQGHVECGSLSDPCFTTDSCPRGCGGGTDSPVTWIIGPIYCVSTASAGVAFTCDTGNMYVHEDVSDTMENPKRPACGSLHDPCFANGSRCYGCGPDVVEWVIGPIYCV